MRPLRFPGFDSEPIRPKQWPRDGARLTPANIADAINRGRSNSRANKKFEDLFAFQCRAYSIPAPQEQYRFATELDRQWRFDFAWPQYKLAVEVNGGVWRRGGGAHSHPQNILRDFEKGNDAALLGWSVLEFTTDQVKSGEAIGFTQKVLAARGWKRQPQPTKGK